MRLWFTLSCVLFVSAPIEVFGDTADPIEQAGAKQVAGISAAQRGDYEQAYQLFSEAYRLYPEAKSLYLIARVQTRRGESCEVVTNAWRRFLSECQGCAEADKGERALQENRERCEGELTLESQPNGAEVSLDGVVIGSTPLQKRLNAGRYSLRFELEGYEPLRQPLELTPNWRAQRISVELTSTQETTALAAIERSPTDAPQGGLSTQQILALTSAALGVSSLAMGLYLNRDAASQQQSLQGEINSSRSPEAAQSLFDEGYPSIREKAQLSYLVLGFGSVLIATGGTLWLLDRTTEPTLSGSNERISRRSAQREVRESLWLLPYFEAGGGGLSLSAGF